MKVFGVCGLENLRSESKILLKVTSIQAIFERFLQICRFDSFYVPMKLKLFLQNKILS